MFSTFIITIIILALALTLSGDNGNPPSTP
ncbi:hypothetical protein PP47_gp16 [Pectobacterium phage PP47]|uniref:Uncharacterized protein n=2 Tax=Pektosvirus TaxID=2732689 RepID=A0A3B8G4Y9_9CAUD|nr:hypothetical protein HOR48_gp16 [Pectobacterium phage PP81]YP_009788713.1 hypothetical protein HOR52_gp16 [Pectobacterium phage PP47]AYM47370.1 hypothetical protein PP47_gp16 [Pectobacterium phage PP47]AYM47381.1 hypothetical protein PP81_gp16 [Pectobacterium phage PP81]